MSEARIVITADVNKAVSEVERLNGAFSSSMGSIGNAAAFAGKAIGLLGLGAAAINFANSIKQAIDLADSLNKLSQRTGVAVESLSQLQYAAKLSDVSAESLTGAFKKLNVSIAGGIAGDKEKLAVFQALGITLTDTAGRTKSADQVLLDMADTFAKSKDGAGKTAAAIALMGKAGDEMIPFLNGGAAAIKALMKEADKLGLTISADFAKQSEEFNDNLTRLKTGGEKLGIILGNELVGSIGLLVQALTDKKLSDASGPGGSLMLLAAALRTVMETVVVLGVNLAYIGTQIFKPITTDLVVYLQAARAVFTLDYKGFNAISESLAKENYRARDEVEKLSNTILRVQALGAAGGGRGFINPPLVDLNKLNQGPDKPEIKIPKLLTEVAKIDPQIKAYESLIASIKEKINLNNEELLLSRKLTESEKQIFEIQKLVEKGNISAADANNEKTKTLLHELSVSERLQEIQTANLELAKTLRDEKIKFVETITAANATSLEQNKTLNDEIELIGLSNQAQHDLTQARLQDVIGIKEQALARFANAEFMSREQIALEEEIRLLRERAGLLGQKFERTAEFDKLTELAKQSKQFTDDLERGLTDSLFRAFEAGQGFFKTLWEGIRNLFKTTVLKLVIQSVVGGSMSAFGMAAANADSGASSATASSMGIMDTVSKVYSTITGSFAALGDKIAFAAQDIGVWLQANTTGALNSAGTSLMQGSGALGTAAGYAAGAAAGIILGRSISGEFSAFGNNKNTAVVAGTAIGAIFGGSLGAAIGGAIGGLINRAFGMGEKRTVASGITGTFNTQGANLQNFQDTFQKGGFFRSDRSDTNLSNLNQAASDAINKALGLTSNAVRSFAAMIGLSADAVSGFSQSIRISLLGLSAADAEKAVLDAIGNFGEAMATSAYGAALQAFKLANETNTAALNRLASDLTLVNTIFATMGRPLTEISLSGADAASKLVAMAGGLQKFTAQTDAYYAAFYSDAERSANVTRQLTGALSAVGLAMPSTRAGFRALVEAQDLMTAAGRTTYAVLLALAPAFAEISTAVEQVTNVMSKTVAGAFVELRNLIKTAENDLINAFKSAANVLSATADRFASVQNTFADFAKSLANMTGAGQSLADLQNEFARLSDMARLGDANAASNAVRVGDQLASKIIATAGSRSDANLQLAILAAQANVSADIAAQQKSIAQQQLAALKEVVEKLVDVEDKTLSVEEATINLRVLQSIENTSIANAISGGFGNLLVSSSLSLSSTAKGNELAASILNGINTMAKIQQDQDNAAQAERTRQSKITSLNASGLSAAQAYNTVAASQQTVVGAVNASIADIFALASQYGLTLQAQPGDTGNTAQFGVDGAGIFQATYNQITGNPNNFAAFKNEFYAPGGVYERTYGQVGLMARLSAQVTSSSEELQRQRELVRALGATPAFASGGSFTGGLRMVGENGPELEVTGPSRIYNATQTRSMLYSNNTDMLQELRALRAELEGLRAEAQATASHTHKTAKILSRVTQNGESITTTALV